jgi:nucleoside-diphosphate-sugar epimerase
MAGCALVCGAGGFIGGHLVKRLKRDGFWVRGVGLKFHEFSETEADEVWGDGEQTRSFLYIGECVEATVRLLRSIRDRDFGDRVHPLSVDGPQQAVIVDIMRQIRSGINRVKDGVLVTV